MADVLMSASAPQVPGSTKRRSRARRRKSRRPISICISTLLC
jgi:hypothetical protein